MRVLVCDKCGAEIESRNLNLPNYFWEIKYRTPMGTTEKDLCEKCADKLKMWFLDSPEEDEE